MTSKEYKIVLAGAFGSGRSTFASRFVNAAEEKKKIGMAIRLLAVHRSSRATVAPNQCGKELLSLPIVLLFWSCLCDCECDYESRMMC